MSLLTLYRLYTTPSIATVLFPRQHTRMRRSKRTDKLWRVYETRNDAVDTARCRSQHLSINAIARRSIKEMPKRNSGETVVKRLRCSRENERFFLVPIDVFFPASYRNDVHTPKRAAKKTAVLEASNRAECSTEQTRLGIVYQSWQ